MSPLDRAFYGRDVVTVARDLIGCRLISVAGDIVTAGRIVETEAYAGEEDPASHAARLRTGNVRAMWGPPGIAYVYLSYGIHAMLNVVAGNEGDAAAVLIRALEPLEGIEIMEQRRGLTDVRRLCAGPGSLTVAMGITLDDHGLDLTVGERIWIEAGEARADLLASGRIGISRGIEVPWRFFVAGSRYVSAHRRGLPVPPVLASEG